MVVPPWSRASTNCGKTSRCARFRPASFEANALYLEMIRLAYNLVAIFQRLCLPEEWQSLTLSKLRHRLFWLPGELTRPQNRPTLRLANSRLIAMWAEQILDRIRKLRPLEG